MDPASSAAPARAYGGPMLESTLEAAFVRHVRLHLGGKAVKMAPVEAGLPDRLVLLPGGRLYLVELKTETGRVSAIQRVWHSRAAALGCTVRVLHGAEALTWDPTGEEPPCGTASVPAGGR